MSSTQNKKGQNTKLAILGVSVFPAAAHAQGDAGGSGADSCSCSCGDMDSSSCGCSSGPDSSGCGCACQSGDTDSGGGGGGGGVKGGDGAVSGSTPFLFTWNGKNYESENDFLFGKPTTLFATKEIGLKNYEAGYITGDVYKVQNTLVHKDGKLSFQIREIEPEESFIDTFSVTRFIYPKKSELIVDANLQDLHIFSTESLLKRAGIQNQVVLWNGKNVSEKLGDVKKQFDKVTDDGNIIKPNIDTIEISARVTDPDTPVFLIIRSFYRDWTLGDIFEQRESIKKVTLRDIFSSVQSPRDYLKAGTLAVAMLCITAASSLGAYFRAPESSSLVTDAQELASIFKIKTASADIPVVTRSIITEYWNGSAFVAYDVLSPRYYQMTLNAVRIPSAAIQQDGAVRLRVTATHKHSLNYLGLVSKEVTETPKAETLTLTKAFHQREQKDYAEVLNTKYSGKYLHTIPADIVDVEFSLPTEQINIDEQASYVIAAHGVYTQLSPEAKKEAGNWVAKLDPQSREWLEKMSVL